MCYCSGSTTAHHHHCTPPLHITTAHHHLIKWHRHCIPPLSLFPLREAVAAVVVLAFLSQWKRQEPVEKYLLRSAFLKDAIESSLTFPSTCLVGSVTTVWVFVVHGRHLSVVTSVTTVLVFVVHGVKSCLFD